MLLIGSQILLMPPADVFRTGQFSPLHFELTHSVDQVPHVS
jgi:hypothetical protein